MSSSLIQHNRPETMEDVHIRIKRIEVSMESILAMLQQLGNASPHIAQVVNKEIQKLRRELKGG